MRRSAAPSQRNNSLLVNYTAPLRTNQEILDLLAASRTLPAEKTADKSGDVPPASDITRFVPASQTDRTAAGSMEDSASHVINPSPLLAVGQPVLQSQPNRSSFCTSRLGFFINTMC